MNGLSISSMSGGRSGGPISFFLGVMALLTSAGMGLARDHKDHVENEKYRAGHYNMGLQIDRYDNYGQLMSEYYYKRVKKNIKSEYPNMPPGNVEKIMWMAMGKDKMESETSYNYYVPDRFACIGDIKRFVTEDCRVRR